MQIYDKLQAQQSKKPTQKHSFESNQIPNIRQINEIKRQEFSVEKERKDFTQNPSQNLNIKTIDNLNFQHITHNEQPQTQQKQSSLLFKQQISIKLNEILNKNQILNTQYYNNNNDNSNFEQIIKRNKLHLKKQRQKRQFSKIKQRQIRNEEINNKQFNMQEQNGSKDDHIKMIVSNRLKTSMDNYNLQKDSNKKMQYKQKDRVENRLQKKINDLKNSIGNRVNKKKISKIMTQSNVIEESRVNLFDNIQNYLANPHKKSNNRGHSMSQKKLINRHDLQIKLKQIQRKLNNMNNSTSFQEQNQLKKQQKQRLNQSLIEYGIFDWRRVELPEHGKNNKAGKRLSLAQSNFDKEVNYLSKLQQRSEKSFEKYLQNQKLLIDLKNNKPNITNYNQK